MRRRDEKQERETTRRDEKQERERREGDEKQERERQDMQNYVCKGVGLQVWQGYHMHVSVMHVSLLPGG